MTARETLLRFFPCLALGEPASEDPFCALLRDPAEKRLPIDSRGYLIRQNVVALHAIIEAIASDELEDVDPERWWELAWSTYDYGNWGYRGE